MPKTNFVNGTVVSPDFLNAAYKTGGGHVHDGADDDGHSSKINLADHTAGTLPFSSVGPHVHISGDAGLIDLANHVTGNLSFSHLYPFQCYYNIDFSQFSSSGSTKGIFFKSPAFNVPLYGGNPDNHFISVELIRGFFIGFIGVSNGASFVSDGVGVPLGYRPTTDFGISVPVIEGDIILDGALYIAPSGDIAVLKHHVTPPTAGDDQLEANQWASTGNKGIMTIEVSYANYTVVS